MEFFLGLLFGQLLANKTAPFIEPQPEPRPIFSEVLKVENLTDPRHTRVWLRTEYRRFFLKSYGETVVELYWGPYPEDAVVSVKIEDQVIVARMQINGALIREIRY